MHLTRSRVQKPPRRELRHKPKGQMNGTMLVMLLIAAVATVLLCAWLAYRKRSTRLMANTNVAPTAGIHDTGRISYIADAAITRWHVVKIGSTAAHVAVSASATDVSYGVAEDEAEAAGDMVRVAVFGAATGTTKAIAAAAITHGALVQSNGDGKVKTAVSTGYAIGRALTGASGDGDLVEIAPIFSGVALA